MDSSRQSLSLNSSFTSEQEQSHFDNMECVKTKTYVKELLKSRIFLGRYIERRLIDKSVGYRDIVSVSPAEIELKKDLLDAQKKLKVAYPNIHWIGITDTDSFGLGSAGICLCTEIDNQPFGPFWFQIKSLKFRENEVMITLKCLRHITDTYLEIEPILTGGSSKLQKQSADKKLEVSVESLNETYTDIVDNLKSVLTVRNVKEFITFLFALIIALFTGSTAFINFLGNFILALIREMSLFVKNSTPMFLGLLDFFSKIVGGFYILLAMFFRPTPTVPGPQRTLTYFDRPYKQNVNVNSREFD